MKGYGRLASYTHIDKLFGGHLLSSIVCEECNTCIQRVEPFLDLSLSISLPSTSSTSQEDLTASGQQIDSNNRKKNYNTRSSKNKQQTTNKEGVVIVPEPTKPVLSKHLTKKQQKKAAKTAKVRAKFFLKIF